MAQNPDVPKQYPNPAAALVRIRTLEEKKTAEQATAQSFEVRRKAHLHLLEGYVARAYLVEPADIYSRTRGRADVAEARQLIMYLAHVEMGLSMAEVAYRYGRDRSTAAYACREVEDRREDPVFDNLVSHIEALITMRRDPVACSANLMAGQLAPVPDPCFAPFQRSV